MTRNNDEALAEEGLTHGGGETLHRGLAAIVGTENLTITRDGESDLIFGPGTKIAILIDNLGNDKGGVLAHVVL